MPTDTSAEDPHEEIEIERRQVAKMLAGISGAGAIGAFSVSALAGLGESGKIVPPEPLFVEGVRLVDAQGNPLTAADALPTNEPGTDELETTTVYPEKEGGGTITKDRAAVLLVRFPGDSYQEPTNLDGTVEGYAAYSKVCTHLGCSVGGTEGDQLYCPCHGSVFDPLQGAKVTNGPAPSPLAQLPIGVTDGSDGSGSAGGTNSTDGPDGSDGQLLLATGPFEGPVGPQ
ncbi:QcrA and Rieske domain-containing protein [Halorientalis pallida]|uniref:Rieske (2Fe-2S) protein n=1 Tax=Halorientalis pallida TaxID=2479928 RepID=A0A498KXY8_9EURY|nr:Rieske (2Fe-2S) protein [Halorientalis pallida]RXK50470.1 Rieske (2Fe-2S) protein [Halorientalis pallida]